MDVTKSNFKSLAPTIKSAISNASFISIDCEFSGLNLDNSINSYDTYKQYYSKIKRNVNNFLVLQYGLCIFRYDKDSKGFKQQCYNFYIFPRPVNRNIPDIRFNCQASSIDFLAGHNFDFNKVFKEGVSYLNKADETKYKQVLEERLKNKANNSAQSDNATNNPIPIPVEEKEFVEDTMQLIEKFLESDDDELMLPQCNAFRRRLLYQTSRERFGARANLETRIVDAKNRQLYALKPDTPEKRAEREQLRLEQSFSELEEAVGFSSIIQHISDSRKLVVGHNLCLDLLYTIDKFLMPLPDDYIEFKECANCLFPKILDTKYMASTPPLKDLISNSMLGNMLDIFKNKPFTVPTLDVEDGGQGYTLGDEKEHEAGYDAYITGLCFLTMASYLDKSDEIHLSIEQGDTKLLRPYLNRLFVLKLQDCPYIALKGNDPKLSRDHVLHITFPREWKILEINQLFSPFGNVHVAWLSDQTAYVALFRRDQAAHALKTLSQSNTCTVISYARHQAMMNSNSSLPVAPSPTPAAKKKRESELSHSADTKKRRRETCFGESSTKRRFESITEQPEDEAEPIATKMTKMFDEYSAWD